MSFKSTAFSFDTTSDPTSTVYDLTGMAFYLSSSFTIATITPPQDCFMQVNIAVTTDDANKSIVAEFRPVTPNSQDVFGMFYYGSPNGVVQPKMWMLKLQAGITYLLRMNASGSCNITSGTIVTTLFV
jgi:hypothetical protein